ncbi:protein-L-isoaspartate O-methyltransferase [soil metagenome]
MGDVPREEFVPEAVRADAYADGALPIGSGQTISQPWVVAAICSALELEGGERVLEIGTGSGYSTAIIADLVGPRGSVMSAELVPELAKKARTTLGRLGYDRVVVSAGDGVEAAAEGAWDAIAVHAAAPAVPPSLARALGPGGRLVIPVADGGSDMLTAFRRAAEGGASGEPLLTPTFVASCRFVPLLGESGFPSSGR